MVVSLSIGITSDQVNQRTHNRILKLVNQKSMYIHRDKRMGKHYKDIPETRPGGGYGYDKRSKRYQERKKRKKGHNRPNEWSGKTKRYVRNNSKITATRKGAKFRAKNYFKMREQMRSELEAITPQEEWEIEQDQLFLYYKEADKPENRRKRKRKIRG